jgi:hypothetical protein
LLGLAVLTLIRHLNLRVGLVALVAIAPLYIIVRSSGLWDGSELVTLAKTVSEDRAQSLEFRLTNEDQLAAKALMRPIFGWGGWNDWRVFDSWGRDISISDGLWIIELGTHGLVGMISCFMAMLLPAALVALRTPRQQLGTAIWAPALSLSALVALYAIDCLLNAMICPIYMLAGGGLASIAIAPATSQLSGARTAAPNRASEIADCVPRRRLYPHST